MEPIDNAKQFFATARERQSMYRKKEKGLPPPWTNDHVMGSIYLCNVFREQDKTTKWFRENIREPFADDPERSLAYTVLFRWFNRIETGQVLWGEHHFAASWLQMIAAGVDPLKCGEFLSNVIEERCTRPYFTGAYMIKLENGVDKHLSVAHAASKVTKGFLDWAKNGAFMPPTLEGWTKWLQNYNGLGGFMAYEIASDLRWTILGRNSSDIMTWANIGPGCARGLSRIYHGHPDESYMYLHDSSHSLEVMNWLLNLSRQKEFWPLHEQRWEMREVEHWLCEYDKIQRARSGTEGRIKRKYHARMLEAAE